MTIGCQDPEVRLSTYITWVYKEVTIYSENPQHCELNVMAKMRNYNKNIEPQPSTMTEISAKREADGVTVHGTTSTHLLLDDPAAVTDA